MIRSLLHDICTFHSPTCEMLDVNIRDNSTEVDARAFRHSDWLNGDGLDGHCFWNQGRVG